MNIFRSEAHAQNWSKFDGDKAGVIPVPTMVQMVAHPLFRERLAPDYFGRGVELFRSFMEQTSG